MDQHVRCLIQRPSHAGIAGAADAGRPIHLPGLEPPRSQPEMRTHRPGVAEPCWVIHAGGVGQGDERTNARHRHQPLASGGVDAGVKLPRTAV